MQKQDDSLLTKRNYKQSDLNLAKNPSSDQSHSRTCFKDGIVLQMNDSGVP